MIMSHNVRSANDSVHHHIPEVGKKRKKLMTIQASKWACTAMLLQGGLLRCFGGVFLDTQSHSRSHFFTTHRLALALESEFNFIM